MIIDFDKLKELKHKVAMVDGGFDPLHEGHIAYFTEAAKLGVPVLCSISSDEYVSTKHSPLLSISNRAKVIDEMRSINYVYCNEYDTKTVLGGLCPIFYIKGNDWDGCLPKEELDICNKNNIKIVYLDTIKNSSTQILKVYMKNKTTTKQVENFEQFVLEQVNVDADKYDEDYFATDWREQDNCYTVEARRKIEGRNPQLIKEVFQPKKVLDMGCGPGALMYLLNEAGVEADGVDFSEDVKQIAHETIKDRISTGSVTDVNLPCNSYDLVICREVFEHLTVLQVQQAVENISSITSQFVYVTTRFHPDPETLFDVTNEFDVDPTHINLMNKDLLRLMFVLQGFKRRKDLEEKMDWLNKNRVLVYEKQKI